ncbi:MAG: BTAD domain-containing putative transcriptional regulator [Actinomycetota bacterium]
MATTSHAPAPSSLESEILISLLGPLRVSVGGRPVDLGRPQNELVLARLALSVPAAVSMEALVDAVWDEDPPPSGRKNLQKCISELRRQLGPDAIRTERSGYVLAVPVENVDMHAAAAAVDAARAARARRRLDEAWDAYGRAASLWHERALDGLVEVGFVVEESRRLEEARISMFEEQVDVGLELGKHAELAPLLRDLTREHPLRERLWGALMVTLYRSGRQADALAAYHRLRDVLAEELGVEPSPEIRKLEERILLHSAGLSFPPRRADVRNAPVGYTSFVGRDTELAALSVALEDARLVTLTGAGGSGKTRLALQAATGAARSFREGAWFADLASVSEGSEVVPTVASLFGLAEEPGASAQETLLGFLEGAEALLVLDNCEHLAAAAAALAAAILGSTRSVVLLATSREPLGLTGERLFPVAPMPIPTEDETDPERLAAIDSVRLFTDRAAAVDPGFAVTPEVAPLVGDICRRLDGIPLAIELAARQLHVLGLEQLRRGLLDHVGLGAPGEPDARHRTMEAAIGWSFDLIDEEHRRLFLALSVFPGSFNPEAAQSVTGTHDQVEMMRVLSGLVACSMLVRVGDERARYRLLEPIRDYAAKEAARRGLTDEFKRAHCAWVLALFEGCSPIRGPHEREYLRRLSAEHHHFLAALDWATGNDPELALRLLVAGIPYTQMVVYRFRWTDTASLAIASDSDIDPRLRAEALARGAEALAENFEHDKVRAWATTALEMAEELKEPALAGYALLGQGWSHRGTGAMASAEDCLRDGVGKFEEAGDLIGIGHALHALSFVLMAQGHHRATLETSAQALDICLKLGSDWGAGRAWWHFAAAHTRAGAYDEAREAVVRALKYFEGFEDIGSVTHVRAVQGDIARLSGHTEWAREIYLSCLQGFQEIGDRRCTASTFRNLGLVAIGLGRDDEAVGLLQAGLRRRHDLADVAGVTECLEGLALLARRAGWNERAVGLLAVAARLRGETSASSPPAEEREIGEAIEGLKAAMGLDHFWESWREKEGLPFERIVADALSMRFGDVS